MHDHSENLRWPRKGERSSGWKDKSKWCTYHGDFIHITEEYITLRKEINYLLRKVYLKEILRRRKEIPKEKEQDPMKILEKPGSPLSKAKVVNVISGGSDICGTSYSAAKRDTKVSKAEKDERPRKNTPITSKKEITCDEQDR